MTLNYLISCLLEIYYGNVNIFFLTQNQVILSGSSRCQIVSFTVADDYRPKEQTQVPREYRAQQ